MLPLDMTHADKPLVTITVAVFNGAKTLQRCITSVNSQTYSFKELIMFLPVIASIHAVLVVPMQ